MSGTAEQRREDSAAQAAAAAASDAVPGDGRAAAAEARMAGTGDVDDWMGLDTGQVGTTAQLPGQRRVEVGAVIRRLGLGRGSGAMSGC